MQGGSERDIVELDDLADPKFPDEVVAMRQMLEQLAPAMALEPGPLHAAAVEQTGLTDFGDWAYEERLALLCDALRTEGNLSPSGHVGACIQMTALLKNRLLIQDLLTRHPEIRDVEIARPIIIAGLPRTGTTHLHNLLAADPALRSLPYWESLEPVLADAEQPAPGEPDPRLARTAAAVATINSAMPYFERMHEMTTEHVHEEIQLLAIDFSTMLFETVAPMPTWRDYYLSHDQRPSYAYLARVLKVLQWARGGTRWVLKSPQHLEQFPALSATFPDATFVVTHRDPVAVTASMATMIAYGGRMSRQRTDPMSVGRYWAERLEMMLRRCVDDRGVLPDAQSIDVRFDEFMADDIAMVSKIYGIAGQPFTPSVRAAMAAFMEAHPRGRHGGVRYDLSALGLDRDERRAALAFYSARFGV
jgi:Sulfotransferase family